MDLHVTLAGDRPLGRQIYEQIREAIINGRLLAGERLPATRQLAAQLETSRNTVTAAYELLAAEGFVESRLGSGVTVRGEAGTPPRTRTRPHGPLAARAVWSELAVPAQQETCEFDFRVGAPDASLFPLGPWSKAASRELRDLSAHPAHYRDPSGERRLRAAIARHAAVSRSVVCDPADVMVTCGAQQAFDLIGRCLLEPGDIVAVEDPGYPMARLAFQALGATVTPVRVDDEGLVIDELPDSARIVFVTPSHQFPMGVPMSLRRRYALLAWAARCGAAIVEDDYNGELRFDGRPLEPLQRLDQDGRVIFVSSFSKILHPGLRLGYLVAPPSLRRGLQMARLVTDWHSPLEQQGALTGFIERGHLATHLRRIRGIYGARRSRLRESAGRLLPSLALLDGVAGLHLGFALKPGGPDAATLAAAARAHGVGVSPWSDFGVCPARQSGLALGFGVIAEDAIEAGIRRLAEAFAELRPGYAAGG